MRARVCMYTCACPVNRPNEVKNYICLILPCICSCFQIDFAHVLFIEITTFYIYLLS